MQRPFEVISRNDARVCPARLCVMRGSRCDFFVRRAATSTFPPPSGPARISIEAMPDASSAGSR
jgi:hypothetical protein